MAVVTQKSVASLMRKTLDRQAAVQKTKVRFKKNQIEQILLSYARDNTSVLLGELMKVLQECPLNDNNFQLLMEDCLSSVLLLGRELSQFVDVVCAVEWATRDDEPVEMYSNFICSLVTAHPYHCHRIMTSLLKLFKGEGENWGDSPSKETLRVWSNIHSIIAQIMALMPMFTDLFIKTLIDQFPYYKAGCYANRAYIHNLIWISKYIPSLTEQIMTVIVSRMVTVDANIVEKSKSKEQQIDTMFQMDVDGEEDFASTLDFCMIEVLKWLEDERDPVLDIMCNVFERVVLPTHGIRHVQFLLLYTISINQHCADRILNNLWTIAAGRTGIGSGAIFTRKTAASHLAGLLARCVRVPNTRLIKYLKNMVEWCHSYITATQESSTASDNTKVHGAFHAICHAVFYLVAFKHHHLFSSKENINFIESLNLARLVTCPLNPLHTCPPQVTRAFASVTRAHQVAYCQTMIEKNARHMLLNSVEYDEWFPYDPYTLPVSGKIIWPLCIEYKDFSKDGDDETQYAGMKRKMEADDEDYFMSASPSQKLASSLSNCISPGFKTSESIII